MIDDWSRTAEQLMLATIESKIRVLAVTSPISGAGVTTVARGLAATFARAGRTTLLIDLSGSVRGGDQQGWCPGEAVPADAITTDENGLAVMTVVPSEASRALFGNVALLTQAFQTDLAAYASIILDLPAIDDNARGSLNPVAAARAGRRSTTYLARPNAARLENRPRGRAVLAPGHPDTSRLFLQRSSGR